MKAVVFSIIMILAVKVYFDNFTWLRTTSISVIGTEIRREINDIATPSVVEQPIAPVAPAITETPTVMVTFADIAAFTTHCKGEERVTAIHEAGHFWVYVQQGIGIFEASLVKTPTENGFVRPLEGDQIGEAAGYAAEIMFIGKDKSVEDYMRRKGYLSRKLDADWDLARLINAEDKTAAYDLVVEACKKLDKHESEILAIASCLYKRKTLNQSDCHALQQQLNKEGNGQ